jgi:hypothetical protein
MQTCLITITPERPVTGGRFMKVFMSRERQLSRQRKISKIYYNKVSTGRKMEKALVMT